MKKKKKERCIISTQRARVYDVKYERYLSISAVPFRESVGLFI